MDWGRQGGELGEGDATLSRHAAAGCEARRVDLLCTDSSMPGMWQPLEKCPGFPGADGGCRSVCDLTFYSYAVLYSLLCRISVATFGRDGSAACFVCSMKAWGSCAHLVGTCYTLM